MAQQAFAQLQSKTLEQQTGSSLFGKDGAFAPMLNPFLDIARAKNGGRIRKSKSVRIKNPNHF